MKQFFIDHWKVMMIGLAGVILGVLLNNLFRTRENKHLLELLTNELSKLQAKLSLTPDEQNQLEYLKGEIYILQFKCR